MRREKPIISTRSQDRDYNCGVFALKFLFELIGMPIDVRKAEKQMGTTDADGTKPDSICSYVHRNRLAYVTNREPPGQFYQIPLPAIVLYRKCKDDHYSVLLFRKQNRLTMYDPEDGRIRSTTVGKFVRSWWTKRYGSGWWMHIPLNQ